MYLKIMNPQRDGEFSLLTVSDDVHVGIPPEGVEPTVVHEYHSGVAIPRRQLYFFNEETLQPHLVVFPANTAFLMNADGRTIERL